MSLIAKHILVKGKVQGVFYRKNTKEMAKSLNLTGWVKNTDDGHVEIFVQGDESAVGKLTNWCRQGSPKADVIDVISEDSQPDASINSFFIDR